MAVKYNISVQENTLSGSTVPPEIKSHIGSSLKKKSHSPVKKARFERLISTGSILAAHRRYGGP
jgi:hypothetical protein